MNDTSETPRSGPPVPKTWLFAVAVVVFAIGAYLPSFGASFIWDDHYLIVNSPSVNELQPLASYFRGSFWQREDLAPGERGYYRPLTTLSFALDHAVHGDNPAGYHVTNLALHAACALLLFFMLRRRGVGVHAAFAGTLAWAWLPRLSEAAAWISGRTDILATLFSLCGLSLYERGRLSRIVGALCFLVALFAKEVALAGVLAALVSSLSSNRGRPVSRRLGELVPAFLALGIYLALRIVAVGVQLESGDLSWGARWLHLAEALGRYSVMLLNPWNPGVQLGTLGHPSLGYVLLGVTVTVAAAALIYRCRAQLAALDGFDRAALILFGVSLGLVLHLVPIPVTVIAADRFLYLPTLALALLLVPRLEHSLASARRIWPLLIAIAIASFAPVTWLRARAWADEVEFWTIAFEDQKSNNALSRLELGNLYARAGLFSRACALFLDADEGDYATFLLARNNAGGELLVLGRFEQSRRVLEDVVARAPEVPKFHFSLATAYGSLDRFAEARRELAAALRLHPNYVAAKNYEHALAQREQQTTLTSYPETVQGQLTRAQDASRLMLTAEATQAIVRASELGPLPSAEWVPLLVYAFRDATFTQLETLFRRYREQQTPDPVLSVNFQQRAARVTELRALWPKLAPVLKARAAPAAGATER